MNLISLALATTLSCQIPGNTDVLGLWESSQTSRGGIGSNIEFRSDGSYTAAIIVLVDLNYDIKDQVLYIGQNKDESVNYDQGAEIMLSDSTLTLKGVNGETEVRNRISKSDNDSIVGKYRYRHYTGGIAYEQYTEEGLMKLRIPMSATNGCYTANDDTIIITQEGKNTAEFNYKKDDTQLRIVEPKKTTIYDYVDEGVWYKSDEIDYKKPVE